MKYRKTRSGGRSQAFSILKKIGFAALAYHAAKSSSRRPRHGGSGLSRILSMLSSGRGRRF